MQERIKIPKETDQGGRILVAEIAKDGLPSFSAEEVAIIRVDVEGRPGYVSPWKWADRSTTESDFSIANEINDDIKEAAQYILEIFSKQRTEITIGERNQSLLAAAKIIARGFPEFNDFKKGGRSPRYEANFGKVIDSIISFRHDLVKKLSETELDELVINLLEPGLVPEDIRLPVTSIITLENIMSLVNEADGVLGEKASLDFLVVMINELVKIDNKSEFSEFDLEKTNNFLNKLESWFSATKTKLYPADDVRRIRAELLSSLDYLLKKISYQDKS